MNTKDFLNHLHGVKSSGRGWVALCPAHSDTKQSLTINEGDDGRILVHCHAGCSVEDIVDKLGLTMRDLHPEATPNQAFSTRGTVDNFIAIYEYPGGVQKCRRPDKSFAWRRPDGSGGWIWNRKGVHHTLYIRGDLSGSVCVAEGEKDVDNLHRLGWNAASGADGAGPGKWRKEYTQQLKGLTVAIFQDNDAVGKAYAAETAAALHGVAESVRVLDLSLVWPEIPEHGDISDVIAKFGDEKACDMIADLMARTPEWQPNADDPFLSCFRSLDEFEEQEARWLIPGWIPEGQITLLAADGGIGKTTLWVNLIAAISSGKRSILDPTGHTRAAHRVAFLTTEDSVRKKLKRKLREAGANEKNVISPDFMSDKDGVLRGLKFGSTEMERFIRYFRPALCVFDPVQGFVPPDINMGSRNAMRDCMAPLVSLGEETGTTFLVVCHSNKRKGAYGRDRIADSADLWDVSRSVIMAGNTEDQGIRYLSNEKNNYARLQDTILFEITDGGQASATGTTWKRDREFTQESAARSAKAPKRDDCKEWVLQQLDAAGGSMPSKELEAKAKEAGYSGITFRRAKGELKDTKQIKNFSTGSPKSGGKTWHIQRLDFQELPEDTEIPWSS